MVWFVAGGGSAASRAPLLLSFCIACAAAAVISSNASVATAFATDTSARTAAAATTAATDCSYCSFCKSSHVAHTSFAAWRWPTTWVIVILQNQKWRCCVIEIMQMYWAWATVDHPRAFQTTKPALLALKPPLRAFRRRGSI